MTAPEGGMDPSIVKLAEPHGVRSCKEGGQWEQCRESATFAAEQAAIKQVSRSEMDFRLLRREIASRMAAAMEGRLIFGDRADVSKTRRSDYVLELRFDQRLQYPNEVRAVRLYFSEPDVLPQTMLIAKLAAKPASREGLDMQDDHIDEADLRVRKHFDIIG